MHLFEIWVLLGGIMICVANMKRNSLGNFVEHVEHGDNFFGEIFWGQRGRSASCRGGGEAEAAEQYLQRRRRVEASEERRGVMFPMAVVGGKITRYLQQREIRPTMRS